MPIEPRSSRYAHFTAFLTGVGYHESAWKLADPADLAGSARFGVLERAALDAERGLLDAVFFADSPGLAIFRARYFPQVGFDPLEILAALSRSTTRVGLIATASTTYTAPYDLARRLGAHDPPSRGPGPRPPRPARRGLASNWPGRPPTWSSPRSRTSRPGAASGNRSGRPPAA